MKNIKARSFVSITVTIAFLALFLRIAFENIVKMNIAQNESNAVSTLKLISTGLENYSKNNVGVFPASLSVLIQTTPPYIDKDYVTKSPIKGYAFNFIRLDPYGYSLRAAPVRCNFTGQKVFTITTGGVLMNEECGKKE